MLLKKQYSQLIKGIAVFGGVILLTVIPWLIIEPQSLWLMFSYHLERGLHAESTYGSFVLLGQLFGWTQVDYDFNFGSFNITSALADNLAHYSFYIMAAILLAIYGLFAYQLYKQRKNDKGMASLQVEEETLLMRYVAIAVMAFLLFNKVFSAQYMVWICPLIPLLNIRYKNLITALLLIAGAFTIYIYPFNYVEFEYFESFPVLIMSRRNLLLIIAFALILIARKPRDKKLSVCEAAAPA
jgi:magnesium-transporting ATPase (P-type)